MKTLLISALFAALMAPAAADAAITIASPANGSTFAQGQSVAAAYSCEAPICDGTVANGAPIDTSTLGTHEFTVNAMSTDIFAASRTTMYTVVPALSPPDVALRLTGVSQSRARWRMRRGTRFSYRLNKPAAVSLLFESSAGKAAGSLRRDGRAGSNRIDFRGRISRTKRLRPGRYSLQIVAANPAGQRAVSRVLEFTIVR